MNQIMPGTIGWSRSRHSVPVYRVLYQMDARYWIALNLAALQPLRPPAPTTATAHWYTPNGERHTTRYTPLASGSTRRRKRAFTRMDTAAAFAKWRTTYTPLTPDELALAQALRDYGAARVAHANSRAGIVPYSYRSLGYDGEAVYERADDIVPPLNEAQHYIAASLAWLDVAEAARRVGFSL